MKSLLTTLLMSAAFAMTTHAQRLEVFGGAGLTHFFDLKNEEADYYTYYQQGKAFNAGLGIYSKAMGYNRLGLTIRYMKMGGEMEISQHSQGASSNLKAKLSAYTFDLGLYPLCINNFGIEFQLGTEFSIRTRPKLKGNVYTNQLSIDPITGNTFFEHHEHTIDENTAEYFTDYMALLSTKIGYSFNLKKGYEFTPRINIGYSLSKRFTEEIRSRPGYYAFLLELCLRKNFGE